MNRIPKIDISDYRYDLPEERIAQYPSTERDGSKLLIYNNNIISQDIFRNIASYIPAESLLVFNNTRVIRARLLFRKETGSEIEIFCLEPVNPTEYEQAFSAQMQGEWKCIVGNLKKWKSGILKVHFHIKEKEYQLTAEKTGPDGETVTIRFCWSPGNITFGEVMEAFGHIPLPPYMNRKEDENDNSRYQTVYSSIKGSVAAPTAGLHFTDEVLASLSERGIRRTELTLHIGAGTFKPVKSMEISEHQMHNEQFFFTKEAIDTIRSHKGKIIAVGTTSVRAIESLYWFGLRLKSRLQSEDNFEISQWEPYLEDSVITREESFSEVLRYMDSKGKGIIYGSTRLMILPGYRFRTCSGMITNFHQPGSTLLLLVAAATGERWRDIYDYALNNGFRFLSYGDVSLII